ncbi:MAG: hypothetical protein JWO42_394, partial [Chloroflexi bacterium]|nr:hypothetical protein [Chloroflexota bacterium]
GGAIQARRHLVELQPGSSQAHIELGLDLLITGQLRAARAEFTSVARANPNDSTAYYDLALVDDRLGNANAAIADLRRQISVNKGNNPALIVDSRYLGMLYGNQGRWSDAAAAFTQSVELGSTTYEDYFGLGYSQTHTGDRASALTYLHEAYGVAKAGGQTLQADSACRQLKSLSETC